MRAIIFVITAMISLECLSQNRIYSIPDSTIKKIDQLFAKWDNGTSPGCVIGIVRNDSLIYSKGYGMADLEYKIPISPATLFHMASVSKQFTAYSILLLSKAGKLELDDDIRRYLNWFPDLGAKITIRHLLTHTSGIRDQWMLLQIAGTRMGDIIMQEELVNVLKNQRGLNFQPGSQWSYSNSNYALLAEVIKVVSGKPLRRFTDSAIFTPLQMTNTHFRDDATEIEPRALSYHRNAENTFNSTPYNNSSVGATNLYTNVTDMTKWFSNFWNPKVGNMDDIKLLTTNAVLNNGRGQTYAMGINNDVYNGWRRYSHAGGDASYRSYVAVYPDLKMGIMVFTNVDEIGTYSKAAEIFDLIAPAKTKETSVEKRIDSSKSIIDDTSSIKPFLGNYIYEEGQKAEFVLKGKQLWLKSGFLGEPVLLSQGSNSTYSLLNGSDIRFRFVDSPKKKPVVIVSFSDSEKYRFDKYENQNFSYRDLLKYLGSYYSPELECTYDIRMRDDRLFLGNIKYGEVPISFAGPDHLFTDMGWMAHLFVKRDKLNKVTGFEVNNGRVLHLQFNKMK